MKLVEEECPPSIIAWLQYPVHTHSAVLFCVRRPAWEWSASHLTARCPPQKKTSEYIRAVSDSLVLVDDYRGPIDTSFIDWGYVCVIHELGNLHWLLWGMFQQVSHCSIIHQHSPQNSP